MTVPVASGARPFKVVDADTHLSEPRDLWTSRAPASAKDRVPQVRTVDGAPVWTFDGNVLGPAVAASVVRHDGSKMYGSEEFFSMPFEDIHPAASRVGPRLALMDELGIWAQIVYPNAVGFGGQRFADAPDPVLRRLTVTIWNDAMAEIQEESGTRLFPMGLLPWWDVDECVDEIERISQLGLKGVNTNADPQHHGLPDLGDPHWHPLWAAVSDRGLPVNFHVGASAQQMAYFGQTPWPSLSDDAKLALGSAMMYVSNARIVGNFIYSGVLERFPNLQLVSVESAMGWLPFFLEALDWQLGETAPSARAYLSLKPSEYFQRQVYACFWFESEHLVETITALGVDHCLFETDFPHPTCLFPGSLEYVEQALSGMDEADRRKLLSENAARVYSLSI